MAKKMKASRKSSGRRGAGKVSPYVGPFPPIRTVTFKYVEQLSLNEAVLGNGAYYLFTPSSLYDINNTGTGHQPMYFDQLFSSTGPYTKYRALHTRARITFANTSATGNCQVGVYVSPNGSTPAAPLQALEKPWGKWGWVTGTGGSATVKEFDMQIDHAKALNITKQHLLNDDYFAGAYNTSPSMNFFLVAFTTGSIAAASVYLTLEVDITAQVYGLTNTSTS
jgi:hypothetical protein